MLGFRKKREYNGFFEIDRSAFEKSFDGFIFIEIPEKKPGRLVGTKRFKIISWLFVLGDRFLIYIGFVSFKCVALRSS